ncbi:MAG: SDR family oxidoreductase [Gemmatimonadaceae bacterium]
MTAVSAGTALVTGGSRGIGLAVARTLASAGYRVAMLARSVDELTARAAEVGGEPIVCDVTDSGAVSRATDAIVKSFSGAPDVLVNNAGIFDLATVEETSLVAFRRSLDVNLVAPFLLVHNFLPAMRERGTGHIVTICSVADRTVFPENGAYSASKYGLRALHEATRAELRGTGLRATLISPSAVDTPIWDQHSPDTRPGFTRRRNMLRPEAVAAAVLYAVTQPADVNVDELRISRS